MRVRQLLLLALPACAGDGGPGGTTSGEGSRAGEPGLATTRLDPRADGCRAAAGGSYRCAGPGGWALHVTDDEGRATLSVVDPDGREHPVDAATGTRHTGLSRYGDRVEWWTVGRGRRNAPTALVVTHVAVRPDGPRNSAGERLDLLVVKLGDEPCVTDGIPAAPGARAEARRLAEAAASRPCAGVDGDAEAPPP